MASTPSEEGSVASEAPTAICIWVRCRSCREEFATETTTSRYRYCRVCFEDFKMKRREAEREFSRAKTPPPRSPPPPPPPPPASDEEVRCGVRLQAHARGLLARRERRRRAAWAARCHAAAAAAAAGRRQRPTATTGVQTDEASATPPPVQAPESCAFAAPAMTIPPLTFLNPEQRLRNLEHDLHWLRAHVFETFHFLHTQLPTHPQMAAAGLQGP